MTTDALMSSATAGLRRRAAAVSGACGNGRSRHRRSSGSSPARHSRSRIAPTRSKSRSLRSGDSAGSLVSEYQNLHCRLVDLTTCCREEIASLADELSAADETEDEIALHGELRYVHRLVPVSSGHDARNGPPIRTGSAAIPHRIAATGNSGLAVGAQLARRRPGPTRVEIEVVATGLNFKDLMIGMGMLPKDAMASRMPARQAARGGVRRPRGRRRRRGLRICGRRRGRGLRDALPGDSHYRSTHATRRTSRAT